jgi:hypothetical protein
MKDKGGVFSFFNGFSATMKWIAGCAGGVAFLVTAVYSHDVRYAKAAEVERQVNEIKGQVTSQVNELKVLTLRLRLSQLMRDRFDLASRQANREILSRIADIDFEMNEVRDEIQRITGVRPR